MANLTITQLYKLDIIYCEYNNGLIDFKTYEMRKDLILIK